MAGLRDFAGSATLQPAGSPDRVLGWDVLRGLCALGVALYHLLYWQDLASLNTLGSYGVYLFFVLSGASLAYNYSGRLSGSRDAAAFLLVRWLRLAPLYILVCLGVAAVYMLHSGQPVDRLLLRLLLNATFAFGAYDPAIWALAIGGWSLGIEFAYYLVFPLLLPALPRRALVRLAGRWRCACCNGSGSTARWARRRVMPRARSLTTRCRHSRRISSAAASSAIGAGRIAAYCPGRSACWSGCSMAGLLLWLNPARAGDELLGARGAIVVLRLLCGRAGQRPGGGTCETRTGRALAGRHHLRLLSAASDLLFRLHLVCACRGWRASTITASAMAVKCAVLRPWFSCLSCFTAAASERWFEAPLAALGQASAALAGAPRRSALHRRGQHFLVILRRGDARIGLVAVVGQRALDDLVELVAPHPHGSQA